MHFSRKYTTISDERVNPASSSRHQYPYYSDSFPPPSSSIPASPRFLPSHFRKRRLWRLHPLGGVRFVSERAWVVSAFPRIAPPAVRVRSGALRAIAVLIARANSGLRDFGSLERRRK